MLGGVRIAHVAAVRAHSDGDRGHHALCDALLGAADSGDIGEKFPPTDPALRGADSRTFLRQIAGELADLGFVVSNVDVTVIAKSAHPRAQARDARASCRRPRGRPVARQYPGDQHEGLGALGRREGFAAHAVAVLTRTRSPP